MTAKKKTPAKKKAFVLSDEELDKVLSDEELDNVSGGSGPAGAPARVIARLPAVAAKGIAGGGTVMEPIGGGGSGGEPMRIPRGMGGGSQGM